MCGRMNIKADPLSQIVSGLLGIEFRAESNDNVCPSQMVAAIGQEGEKFQVNASWGVQPHWANKLLINAQSETVAQKSTFQQAFAQHRCIVPCSGWYEWRLEKGKKVKYLFEHADQQPFYMAGLLFDPSSPKLITLTTSPNEKCAPYHQRMPMLIEPEHIDNWFDLSVGQVKPLLNAGNGNLIQISAA